MSRPAAEWCRRLLSAKNSVRTGSGSDRGIFEMKLSANKSRLRTLTDEYVRLAHKLRLGGRPDKIEKIHKQGKLTARERVDLLLDHGSHQLEIGLLVAYDQYDG